MKKPNRQSLTLAFCIALFPPIWAVLAPVFGVETGAVALICAGVFASANNDRRLALPMSLGFLAGDGWAVLALWLMGKIPLPGSWPLFVTLFVMGGAAVLIAASLPRLFYCPAWLCGWAIGLTILSPETAFSTTPLQIGAAMLAGIWYVGVGVDWIHSKIRG